MCPKISLPPLATHNGPPDNLPDICNGSLSNNLVSDPQSASSNIPKPFQLLNLGLFNVCALLQADRQMSLALMMT